MLERAFIRQIRRQAAHATGRSPIRVGIGDDCAILTLRPTEELLVTTDLFIEDVHFRRDGMTAAQAGERCLTRGLSDVAAMGGRPLAAFLSLALPRALPARWGLQFTHAVLRLAKKYGMSLAGGDTAQHPDRVTADIVVLGAAPRGAAVLRSGAKAGDLIYVTGALGAAQRDLRLRRPPRFKPQPLIAAGLRLRGLAHAMIDTSDGLSTDLAHLCAESRVSAVLNASLVPIAPRAHLEDALHGGEDYQLLFTAPPTARVPAVAAALRITRIGEIVPHRRASVLLRDAQGKLQPLPPLGFQHFS